MPILRVAACRVALRVLEVPLLSVALEALGKGHNERAAARGVTPRVVLLLIGQPLFFTWHPDGQQIVAVRPSLPYTLDRSNRSVRVRP